MKWFFWRVSQGMFLLLIGCLSHGAAADTLLDAAVYKTTANNNTVSSTIVGGLPVSPASTTAQDGGGSTSATSTFDFADSHLSITTSQKRTGTKNDLADSEGDIPFRVTEDRTYSLSGFFKVNDLVDATPGISHLIVALHDVDEDVDLFRSNQTTSSVADASYTLGDSFGEVFRKGELAGTLLADHNYLFTTTIYTQAPDPLGDGGATADGFVSLAIVETPEPGIVWAGGALLLLLGGNRMLRRRLNVPIESH
jgi:hypothetical protein